MPSLLVEIECRAAKPQLADYHHLRAAGCRKRGVPERPELETLSASALDIFRGKRCVPTLHRAGPRTGEEVYFPWQLPPLAASWSVLKEVLVNI